MSENLRDFKIPESFREYVYRLHELGLMEGRVGEQQYSPEVAAILEAVHHVLAGGSVSITVEQTGEPTILRELDSRFNGAHEFFVGAKAEEEDK